MWFFDDSFAVGALCGCLICGFGATADGQERAATKPVELRAQISELSSGSFRDRETAATQLLEAGESAVPLLESSVESEEFEARVRSLRLLQEIYQANDFAASFAAGDALRRLALHQQEMVASFANDALLAQRGLAIDRLKSLGATFQSDESVVEFGGQWRGTDQDMIDLRWCNSIRTLRLSQAKLDDRAMESLRWLEQLTELVIFDAKITDNGLVQLKHVPKLKILHLARTQVSDLGLKHLSQLSSLTFLDLTRTRVTGQGLSDLYSLQQLRHIDLRGLSLPSDAVSRLRTQLPQATVLADE
jgi:hypothetical protein